MKQAKDWSTRHVIALVGGLSAISIVPGMGMLAAEAQSFYPDVPEDYWAKPFIQQLTQANILTGYPDGTFRPQQPIDRDEYAAVIRQAFEVDQERELATASAFADVPKGYWAEAAIEEAYEGGG